MAHDCIDLHFQSLHDIHHNAHYRISNTLVQLIDIKYSIV